jgi:hypothetical protein
LLLRAEFREDLPSQAGTGQVRLCAELTPPGATSTVGSTCPQPSAEEIAKMQAQLEQYVAAIRPAPGTDPQVTAKLELGQDEELLFTTWTASSGAACWAVNQVGSDEGGGESGPTGPCAVAASRVAFPRKDAASCAALCLQSMSLDHGFALEGTVPADAEALRVTTADGSTATYPLVGPRLSDAGLRVFMVDLGAHDWRKAELIRNGAVSATASMPPTQAAYEDCAAQLAPPPTPEATNADIQALLTAMKPYNDALSGCIRTKIAGK